MTTTATGTGLTITDSALAKIREVMAQQELGAEEKNPRSASRSTARRTATPSSSTAA